MEAIARAPRLARVRSLRIDPPAAGAFAIAFGLVLYLALEGGGYDPIVRGQVGVALWWVVLLGALVGVLPARRMGAAGWVGLALLVAFATWNAVALAWTDSAERSVADLGKVAAYAGALALALAVQGRALARPLVNGLLCAIAAVAALAVLSRLHPAWFPVDETGVALEDRSRLSYPLNYWNALAAFVAMGVPLALAVASGGRTLTGRAAAAAAVPVMALCVSLAVSRGGLIALVAGVLLLLALVSDRLAMLATLALTGAGSAVLLVAAGSRDELRSGVVDEVARRQGDELLVLVLITCAGVALVQVALALLARHGDRPRALAVGRGRLRIIAAACVAVAVVAALAAGAPGALSDRWQDFKQPPAEANLSGESVFARLQSSSGNGRYQFWDQAIQAFQTRPWGGTGPGTYELWWARHASIDGFVRDAHSLYVESLAELGIPGLVLIVAFVLLVLAGGAGRALRADPPLRHLLAAATAGAGAFALAAGYDWTWEMGAMAMAFLGLAAVALAGRAPGEAEPARPAVAGRAVLIALALVALATVALPLAGGSALRESQAQARAGRLGAALADARAAERAQPYAASPLLQRALVLEQQGDLAGARRAAVAATPKEPANWRIWLVRSRLAAELGDATTSAREFTRANALNPRGKTFRR